MNTSNVEKGEYMDKLKKIYLASPHMGWLEDYFIKEAFEENWIAPLGPNVDNFEKEVAELVGSKGSVALSSGTAAIHLALKLLNIKKGDIVFCSSLTFIASCSPIIYEGAEPVFIDSESESWNMSPIALERALINHEKQGKLPKAVIVVDLYGQSADMDSIKELCKRYNVPIIEDSAEALGATYRGKHSGTLGDFGVYSFYCNKIITTSGGGMLVTDRETVIERVKFLATQAKDPARYYQHSEIGYNYRMSNILAGIGRGQLRVLEQRIEQKKSIYNTYKKELSAIGEITMMPIVDYGQPNYWLSVIVLDKYSKVKPIHIINELDKYGIESRSVWKPMHLQPVFTGCKFYAEDNHRNTSVSEDIFHRGVCLPSDTKMTAEDMDLVTDIIKRLFVSRKAEGEGSEMGKKVS